MNELQSYELQLQINHDLYQNVDCEPSKDEKIQ